MKLMTFCCIVIIWGNYNTVLFLGKLLWCPVMGKPLQYGQNCRWCQTKPKLNWTELLRMMFASTLDHYSARCALVSLRADHMSLPSLRVVVMSTTSVLTMWRKVFDEWNMDATPKYTKLHQFLLLCCVQCWSSMHHDCDVTPFTSCPFSLLVCTCALCSCPQEGQHWRGRHSSRPKRHQAKALFLA